MLISSKKVKENQPTTKISQKDTLSRMFKVRYRQVLNSTVKRLDILAPLIARRAKPGQFVMVTVVPNGPKIVLPLVEVDVGRGLIAVAFEEMNSATAPLNSLQIDAEIYSILGPLGVPATIKKVGTVVCIAEGFYAAYFLSICRAFKQAGNKVVNIIGLKNKKSLILEAQMRLASHKIMITTEDGSYERRGRAGDALRELFSKEKVDLVYATGSAALLESIVQLTREKNIKCLVQLFPLMLDGTGFCGSCRVLVGGNTHLACVDGPEFDGHQVDFNNLKLRMKAYEEYQGWGSRQSAVSQRESGPEILRKFLSGILKK